MKGLTSKQREILAVVVRERLDRGQAPTLRELAERFGVSLQAVSDRLRALIEKKYLEKTPNRARSLRPTERGLRALGHRRCPRCGSVDFTPLEGT